MPQEDNSTCSTWAGFAQETREQQDVARLTEDNVRLRALLESTTRLLKQNTTAADEWRSKHDATVAMLHTVLDQEGCPHCAANEEAVELEEFARRSAAVDALRDAADHCDPNVRNIFRTTPLIEEVGPAAWAVVSRWLRDVADRLVKQEVL